jgi:hypothetical protein
MVMKDTAEAALVNGKKGGEQAIPILPRIRHCMLRLGKTPWKHR